MENRSQYRRLLRAVFTLVLLIVYGLIFWLTWHKYYSPRMERMFWRKEHLLIVTSPIMLLVALAIKLEDHGCVFYKQERLTILKNEKIEAYGLDEPLLVYRVTRSSRSGNKCKAACMTFRAYRYIGLSLMKSVQSWLVYSFRSLRKYAKMR